MPNYRGILPYGTDDDSVIFLSPLTSAASVTGASNVTGTVTGSPTFDSIKGVASDTVGNYVKFASPTGFANLQYEGQLRFEIESAALWATNAGGANESFVDANSHFYYITWSGTDSTSATHGRLYRNVNGADSASCSMNNAVSETFNYTTIGDTDSFTEIVYSWLGNQFSVYVNGRPVLQNQTFTTHADMFKFIWVAGDRGSINKYSGGYYIRNLQLSSKCVRLSNHPKTVNVAIIGHSFVTASQEYDPAQSPGWDKTSGYVMKGYFAERSINLKLDYYHNAGGTVIDGTGDDFQTIVADAIAAKPDYFFFIGGTNDVQSGSWSAATFETDLLDHLNVSTGLLSVAKKGWILTVTTQKANSTYDADAIVTKVAAANTVINAVPSTLSDMAVIDAFNEFGGESLGNNYFEGEVDGLTDNLHPSAKGHILQGTLMAKALYYILGQ